MHVGTDKQTAVSDSSVGAEVLSILFTHLKVCHHQFQFWDRVCDTLTGEKTKNNVCAIKKEEKTSFLDVVGRLIVKGRSRRGLVLRMDQRGRPTLKRNSKRIEDHMAGNMCAREIPSSCRLHVYDERHRHFPIKEGPKRGTRTQKKHSNITLQDAEKDISYMLALGFKNVVICSARLIALLEAFGMSRLLASLEYKRLSLQFCQPPRCWIKVNLAAVAKMSTSTQRLSRRTLIFWLIEVFFAREHS